MRLAPPRPPPLRPPEVLPIARSDTNAADLEFTATMDASNIEDQLAMLSEAAASVPVESETPLRLLRHYASSILHRQYHETDVLPIRVHVLGRVGSD